MESSNSTNNEPYEQHAPAQIVCLYAMRDEPMYHELQTHLVLWRTKGHIRWLELSAGADVEKNLLNFVQEADCVLLLISSSFFATSMLHRMMESALVEHTKRGVLVIPILARAFDWKESACGSLKALPDNGLPIAEWEHQERAYENIRAGLVRLIPGLATHIASLPIRPKHFQARDLPKGYVPRPKAFDKIKHLLLNHQDNQTTAITTALRGAGGFGKTTLALALCHDPEIQAAFADGILWVELGEQPPRSLDVLNGVLASLDASLSGSITLEEARDRWRTALHDRVCLLVIDDVWQAVALEPLLEGGPQCVRLVTTRNDQVLLEEAERVPVDAMEPEEAIAVLQGGLFDKIQKTASQSMLEALVTRLGCWPLLLTLAHGLLAERVRRGRTLEQALEIVGQAYQDRGVTAFDVGQATVRQQAVHASVDVSLRHLEEFTPARYQTHIRYQELAVFPEDTNIPLTTLQVFWQATGNLKLWETEDLCIHLHRLSLLLTCDLDRGTIRLHDVLRSYLEQQAEPYLPMLHARLLDAYQQVLGLTRWADLPRREEYLWHHLIHHLCQANRHEVLQTTLTDLLYLARKMLYMGVSGLEADLLRACMFEFEQVEAVTPAQPHFTSLHRTTVQISHLLRQVSTLAEVGGLLLSHLGSQPPFVTQSSAFWSELPRPFLTACYPLPRRSSSALIRTLRGHTDEVHCCAVSVDGSFIISASDDETLKVWDATTGEERLTLRGHTKPVRGCAVSADGSFIVSASWDRTLKVWDATTGAERLSLHGHTSAIHSCAVSPDSSFIVSTSEDKTLKVWDAATGKKRLTLRGHTGEVYGCAVSPDGQWIVSASKDETLKVWDAATGKKRLTLRGHTGEVTGCVISSDGNSIVSASEDGTLKVWDAATGAERLSLEDLSSAVYGCAMSADGRIIVSASLDETLKVWDAATGAERLSLLGHSLPVTSCVVSADGSFIVSASWDKTLKVWDAATGAERLSLHGHTNWVHSCAVSPDGQWIVSASGDKTLKVWDAATGEERFSLLDTSVLNDCAVSPDGSFIVSALYDNTLKVWDAATGVERFSLPGHTSSVGGCAVSPDGYLIVSASDDHTLKVWNAQTGQCLLTFPVDGALSGCAFHPDGEHLVACGAQGMYFLRLVA